MRNRTLGAILAIALQIALTGCSDALAKSPNLSGIWRLDAASSTMPRFEGRGRPSGEARPEGEGERRWDGVARGMGGERWNAARRPGSRFRLPDVVRIEQSAERVQLEDSLGVTIGEIVTGKALAGSEDVRRLEGKWHGDRLEVKQSNPRGGQMTQTYHLADDGRTLEVTMKMERGNMPTREFVRVYRREGA